MKKIFFLVLGLILFTFSYPVQAETLRLKNGEEYVGKVVSQDTRYITMQLKEGKILIPKTEVLSPDSTTQSPGNKDQLRNTIQFYYNKIQSFYEEFNLTSLLKNHSLGAIALYYLFSLFRKSRLTLKKAGLVTALVSWYYFGTSLSFTGQDSTKLYAGLIHNQTQNIMEMQKTAYGKLSNPNNFNQIVKAQDWIDQVIEAVSSFQKKLDCFGPVPRKFQAFHTQYRTFLTEAIQTLHEQRTVLSNRNRKSYEQASGKLKELIDQEAALIGQFNAL